MAASGAVVAELQTVGDLVEVDQLVVGEHAGDWLVLVGYQFLAEHAAVGAGEHWAVLLVVRGAGRCQLNQNQVDHADLVQVEVGHADLVEDEELAGAGDPPDVSTGAVEPE